jgi:uncharacterized membrane protein (DUF485 family)
VESASIADSMGRGSNAGLGLTSDSRAPLVKGAPPRGGAKPKKDKGDKGDEGKKDKKDPHLKSKFPQFATRKLKKNTLEAAIASCYRLECAQSMQFHMRMGYAMMIVVQLLTQGVQLFILTVFNVSTANALLTQFSEASVAMIIAQVKRALEAVPRGTKPLPPMTVANCISQKAHPWLGYLMMFLWFSMMTKEIVDCLESIKIIVWLPGEKPKAWFKEKKEKDPNKEDENNSYKVIGKDKDKISHFAFKWKLFALVFILLPHLLVAFFIGYAGMKFLAMTGDPGVLIMKAMALKFILSFDKLFYVAFASIQFERYMKKTKYQFQRTQERNYWNSWLSTVFKLAITGALVGVAWTQFDHMLKLRHYCREYFIDYPEECVGTSCGLNKKAFKVPAGR